MVSAALEFAVNRSGPALLRLATLCLLASAFALAGCGRKGPLDPPPASIQSPGDASQSGAVNPQAQGPIEYGPDGRPIAPKGQKKKLPIDVLID